MNVPTTFTLFRIALVPVFVAAFYLPVEWSNEVCAVVFALAALTDWIDGFLARRLKQVTSFGAFLDPVADKLMVATALVLLVQATPQVWVALPATVIIGREIAVSALREWTARVGEHRRVAVRMLGKVKAVCQLAAIVLMLYGTGGGTQEGVAAAPPAYLHVGGLAHAGGLALLYAATALTLWSMLQYLAAARSLLRTDLPHEEGGGAGEGESSTGGAPDARSGA